MSDNGNGKVLAGKQVASTKKTFILTISLLFAALVGGLIAFGILYVGVKKPNQRLNVQTVVCDDNGAVMKKLNDYLLGAAEGEDSSKTTEAIDYIKSLAQYTADPTCVEALARFYYIARDPQNFAAQIDELKKLAQNKQYPSNLFGGTGSIANKESDYESFTGRSR